MRKSTMLAVTLLLGSIAVLAIGRAAQHWGALAAVNRDRAAFAAVKPCDYEDGSGPTQTYPCVWVGTERGNRIGRTVLYVRGSDGGCFRYLPAEVVCYDVEAEWFDGDISAADAELAH